MDYVGKCDKATAVRHAVRKVIESGNDLRPDLRGTGTTKTLTDAVVIQVRNFHIKPVNETGFTGRSELQIGSTDWSRELSLLRQR